MIDSTVDKEVLDQNSLAAQKIEQVQKELNEVLQKHGVYFEVMPRYELIIKSIPKK